MNRYIKVKVDDVLEALRYMAKPPEERLRLAQGIIDQKTPPPWLDDDVMNALHSLGYVEHVPRAKGQSSPGAMLSTDGRGNVFELRMTAKGTQAMHTGIVG